MRVRDTPKTLEWIFLAGIIGLCIFVWITAGSYSDRGAIWPRMLVSALALAVVVDVTLRIVPRASRGQALSEQTTSEEEETALKGRPWGAYLGAVLLVAIGAYLFGFLTVVPIFVALFMLARGYRTKPLVIVATVAVLTVVLYIVFQEFANLPLTEGELIQYHIPTFW